MKCIKLFKGDALNTCTKGSAIVNITHFSLSTTLVVLLVGSPSLRAQTAEIKPTASGVAVTETFDRFDPEGDKVLRICSCAPGEVCDSLDDPAHRVDGLIAMAKGFGLSKGADPNLLKASRRALSNKRSQDDQIAVLLLRTFILRVGHEQKFGSAKPKDSKIMIAEANSVLEVLARKSYLAKTG